MPSLNEPFLKWDWITILGIVPKGFRDYLIDPFIAVDDKCAIVHGNVKKHAIRVFGIFHLQHVKYFLRPFVRIQGCAGFYMHPDLPGSIFFCFQNGIDHFLFFLL